MLHDSAQALAHVVAGDTTDESRFAVGPGLPQQLGSDSDLKGADLAPRMKPGNGTAAGAGHPLGDTKAECVSRLANRLADFPSQHSRIDRLVNRDQVRAGQTLEVGAAEVRRLVAKVIDDHVVSLAASHFVD